MADESKLPPAIVGESEESSFVFKVCGHWSAKEQLKRCQYVASPPFTVDGRSWALRYYPNLEPDSLVLTLESADGDNKDAKSRHSNIIISLILVQKDKPMRVRTMAAASSKRSTLYINQAELERSGDIKDDCFSVKCLLKLNDDTSSQDQATVVVVPPSDLHLPFSSLLESTDGADMTFVVGGERFSAHRLVLAARSSVFKAELLGLIKEKDGVPIEIHEMEPRVFKCLLHFIYTDSLPLLDMAHLDVMMAGHLLVAADRYNVERLKLICEHELCSHIDASMVATSLVLAEQHSCHALKEACLRFLASPSNLQAMMATDGYEHLKISCPSVLRELITRLLPIPLEAAKDIIMAV